jgi:formyl-CoA transferase
MSMADIFADPHYQARQTIIDVPEATLGTLPQPAVIPKLSRTPGRVTHAGPAMGTHTEEVLGGLLGLSATELAGLRQEGVI